jgi:chloride channel 3/4/5
LAIKTISLPLAIASGLSIGKEGPSVHVAVSTAHTTSRLFNLSRSAFSMREIYAASSAAGVAVAFGAPIGGVIFSLEEMISFGSAAGGAVGRGFLMALVACMVVGGMDPFWTGGLVMFEVHYERDWHVFEVPHSPSPRCHTTRSFFYILLIVLRLLSLNKINPDHFLYYLGNIRRHLRRNRHSL